MSGKAYIDFVGDAAILKRLERLGANVHDVVERAVNESAQLVKADMQSGWEPHASTPTSQTKESWNEESNWNGNKLSVRMGYSVRKGGIAAIFVNYGTPTNQPTDAFLDRAIEGNLDAIKGAQIKVLKEALEG